MKIGNWHQPSMKRMKLIVKDGIAFSAFVLLLTIVFVALRSEGSEQGQERGGQPASEPVDVQAPTIPNYELAAVENLDYSTVRRTQARISLPEHYPRETVDRIAQAVVKTTIKSRKVNAISILFYGPHTATTGAFDVAGVDWAPNGDWGAAHSVRAGDYASFRYRIVYLDP